MEDTSVDAEIVIQKLNAKIGQLTYQVAILEAMLEKQALDNNKKSEGTNGE